MDWSFLNKLDEMQKEIQKLELFKEVEFYYPNCLNTFKQTEGYIEVLDKYENRVYYNDGINWFSDYIEKLEEAIETVKNYIGSDE